MPGSAELLPEYDCDVLERAWRHHGRLALAFDRVVITLSVECARALGDALSELAEIDEINNVV